MYLLVSPAHFILCIPTAAGSNRNFMLRLASCEKNILQYGSTIMTEIAGENGAQGSSLCSQEGAPSIPPSSMF